MLVASLPVLPRIGQAERLPINEARLESRLRMLRPEDATIVDRLRKFVQWQNQSSDLGDAGVSQTYRELIERNRHPAVRRTIEFRMNIRTVMAALRRRKRGETEPPEDPSWGTGPWVRHISANWSHPDFKLGAVFPWLPRARELFEKGEVLKLEELLMNLVWDELDRNAFGRHFELDAIVAFLFKWDILRRWLSYREEEALAQFQAITSHLFPGSPAETGTLPS